MKFVSFNTNGIRARLHQIEALVAKHNPEVIGIQETKVEDGLFPQADLEALGLHAEWFGQKGHYGVALLSRQKPLWVKKGFDGDDAAEQKRLIMAQYEFGGDLVTVVNGYFPQGESRDHPEKFPNKQRLYARLLERLQTEFTVDENLIVMGDMNCRSEQIIDTPLRDTHLTQVNGEHPTYPSWNPTRNIDHILVSPSLKINHVKVLDYDYSDHRPIAMEVALPDRLAFALAESTAGELTTAQ